MKKLSLQFSILLGITFANFLAQIPYTIHLYGISRLVGISLGSLMMHSVFILFISGTILFVRKNIFGYWLLIVFFAMEFLFYLWNFVGSLLRGYPLFFQLFNPDLLLRIVFAVGYLNLFASGYFLFLLLYRKHTLLKK